MMKTGRTTLMRCAAVFLATAISLSAGVGTAMAAAAHAPNATTGSVTSVTPTSAAVTGSVNPNGTLTTWYFQYGLSTSTTYSSKTLDKSAGAGKAVVHVTASLTGLTPATSYHYRVVATSSVATVYGGSGIFNTSAAPSVVTGAASAITATSATLNGIVNPQALATNWYFEYGLSTTYGLKTAAHTLAAGPNNTSVSVGISDLTPDSTYHFRVVATSSAGTSVGVDFTLTTGLSVTLNASASTVVYGSTVDLSGKVASGLSGVLVTIENEPFNVRAFSGIASTTTASGGTWSYTAQPTVRTTFEAIASNGTSSPLIISVRPAVYLSLAASGNLSTRVEGAVSFSYHVLQLQRLSKGLWVTWKPVRLNGSAQATFSTSLPVGKTSIRMAIGPFVLGINQAAPGYLAGFSRSTTYTRK
jgi:hypothetical protein